MSVLTLERPEPLVVVDESDRTAYVFADDAAADAWATTGEATWEEWRPASAAEVRAAMNSTLDDVWGMGIQWA